MLKASPWESLCDLLNETEASAKIRGQQSFDRAAEPFDWRRLVLFGAGGFGKRILSGLRKLNLEPLAFADNNPALWNTFIEGVRVHSPQEAANLYGSDSVFLITIWNSAAKDRTPHRIQQLLNLGCQRVVPAGLLFWKFPEVFLPYFPLDLPHKVLGAVENIKNAYKMLGDDRSRREFVAQVAFRLVLEFEDMEVPQGSDHYFSSGLFELHSNELLVDCGAFDGDSIAEFVKRRGDSFDSILAFEPDPISWQTLQRRLQNLPESIRQKIQSFAAAVGSQNEILYFDASGSDQSRAGQGSTAVNCVRLEAVINFGRKF